MSGLDRIWIEHHEAVAIGGSPEWLCLRATTNPNRPQDVEYIRRDPAVLAALDAQPLTAQDAARVPEIAALIEAAEHLLQNYLRDELDEPDLCVDDEHWSAIHDVNAALRAIAEGRA